MLKETYTAALRDLEAAAKADYKALPVLMTSSQMLMFRLLM